jgi:tRNA 2-thiouridine synthesizing protein A
MHFDKELNARGMNCPLPIIKTRKILAEMTSEQVLKVTSTDCGALKDMPAFAEQTGNLLLSTEEASGEYVFYLKKK